MGAGGSGGGTRLKSESLAPRHTVPVRKVTAMSPAQTGGCRKGREQSKVFSKPGINHSFLVSCWAQPCPKDAIQYLPPVSFFCLHPYLNLCPPLTLSLIAWRRTGSGEALCPQDEKNLLLETSLSLPDPPPAPEKMCKLQSTCTW